MIRRCMTKEVLDYTLFEGAEDADYDSFIRCYNTSWDCLQQKDYQKLDELLQQADGLGISHPYMELLRQQGAGKMMRWNRHRAYMRDFVRIFHRI